MPSLRRFERSRRRTTVAKKDSENSSGLVADLLREMPWVMRISVVVGVLAGLGVALCVWAYWIPAPEAEFISGRMNQTQGRYYFLFVALDLLVGVVVGFFAGLFVGSILDAFTAPFREQERPRRRRRYRGPDQLGDRP